MKITSVASVVFAALLLSCSTKPVSKPTPTDAIGAAANTAAEANLTQEEAELRARAITEIKYRLAIELEDKTDLFKGKATITFTIEKDARKLFLDFKSDAKIQAFIVNSVAVAPDFASHRLFLPDNLLKPGANSVEIAYTQNYSHEGRGLHRFQDPEDGRVYLYSQFEAFDAHQMFPCFDQPDMKATMSMTVTAPNAWQVITTTRESKKTAAGDAFTWSFPESPKISTYLFSLHAGPYHKWESKAGSIPLRLFARESLAKFVKVDDWFTPTKQGLKFYGDYFKYPYPFKKYDQLIVPDFNAGAMENVAAITFTEWFINRGKTTREDRMELADTLLHEMAHMWFGDLVTMHWWNDLWLNESFATYMSHLASSQATEFKDAWIPFFARSKSRAYVDDQLLTTHPVEGHVPDTSSAFSSFDSITYAKGASLLKQLSFYLGATTFRDGVRSYFKANAYKNTRLEDFIASLEHASKKDLHGWSKAWIQTAGLDTAQADFDCDRGKITRFALKLQGPDGQPSPRAHRTQIALYSEKAGMARPFRVVNTEYKGDSTEIADLKGSQCPAMVYPNDDDQDYVKVRLDKTTLAYARSSVAKIEAPFARVMIWPNLFEMVRDVELTPQEFLDTVTANVPLEKDLNVARGMSSKLPDVMYYHPQTTDAQKAQRAARIVALEHALLAKLTSVRPGSDWQLLLLEQFIGIAESKEGRDQLVTFLGPDSKIKGLEIDVDHKWEMIVRLSALGDSRVEPILATLAASDKSERGVEMALAADAAKPALDVKRAWISKVTDQADLSFSRKREVLWNLLPRTQDGLRASLATDYYSSLPKLLATKELNFLTLYARSLIPATCTRQSASGLQAFMSQYSMQLPPPVIKALKNGQQEDSRCVAIREKASVI